MTSMRSIVEIVAPGSLRRRGAPSQHLALERRPAPRCVRAGYRRAQLSCAARRAAPSPRARSHAPRARLQHHPRELAWRDHPTAAVSTLGKKPARSLFAREYSTALGLKVTLRPAGSRHRSARPRHHAGGRSAYRIVDLNRHRASTPRSGSRSGPPKQYVAREPRARMHCCALRTSAYVTTTACRENPRISRSTCWSRQPPTRATGSIRLTRQDPAPEITVLSTNPTSQSFVFRQDAVVAGLGLAPLSTSAPRDSRYGSLARRILPEHCAGRCGGRSAVS